MSVEPLSLSSPCPLCKNRNVWFEIGPGDQPGHESIRLHCKDCGHIVKQDVPNEGGDPVVRNPC